MKKHLKASVFAATILAALTLLSCGAKDGGGSGEPPPEDTGQTKTTETEAVKSAGTYVNSQWDDLTTGRYAVDGTITSEIFSIGEDGAILAGGEPLAAAAELKAKRIYFYDGCLYICGNDNIIYRYVGEDITPVIDRPFNDDGKALPDNVIFIGGHMIFQCVYWYGMYDIDLSTGGITDLGGVWGHDLAADESYIYYFEGAHIARLSRDYGENGEELKTENIPLPQLQYGESYSKILRAPAGFYVITFLRTDERPYYPENQKYNLYYLSDSESFEKIITLNPYFCFEYMGDIYYLRGDGNTGSLMRISESERTPFLIYTVFSGMPVVYGDSLYSVSSDGITYFCQLGESLR